MGTDLVSTITPETKIDCDLTARCATAVCNDAAIDAAVQAFKEETGVSD